MAKHLFSLAARSCSVDENTQQLSLFEVLEDIQAPSFPIFIPEIVFVSQFEKDDADLDLHRARIAITLGDAVIIEQEISFNFRGARRTRVISRMNGLPITQPGQLTFRITGGFEGSAQFHIRVNQAPDTATATAGPVATAAANS